MTLVPYILELDEDLETEYIRLKPTGKYKFVSGPTEELTMYVQHKGFIFKKWIHERDIKFLPERKTEVFKCDGKTRIVLNSTK